MHIAVIGLVCAGEFALKICYVTAGVLCYASLLRCVTLRWVLQCALAYPYSLLITPLWKTENHTVDASSIWD